MTEFTIQLSNRPGQLAGLAKMLADAGVNIEALAAFGVEDLGVVRVLVDDPHAAREVLKEGGLVAQEREVITTIISHEPGTLAQLTQSLADADVNIDGLYFLNANSDSIELALAVDDPDAARERIELGTGP